MNEEPTIEYWKQISSYLSVYSITFKKVPCYECLDELRLVANVTKHEEGKSKSKLEQLNLQLFSIENGYGKRSIPIVDAIFSQNLYLGHTDFTRYHQVAVAFWNHRYWHPKGERFNRA